MIVYIGYGLGILILAAAGILAWRNSRIIADKRETKGAIPAVSSYTVQVARQSEAEESGDMTPLFEATYREGQGTVRVCLSRMNGTISELKLDHAVQIMKRTCSDFAAKGETVQIISHRESAENAEENETVARLEQQLQQRG